MEFSLRRWLHPRWLATAIGTAGGIGFLIALALALDQVLHHPAIENERLPGYDHGSALAGLVSFVGPIVLGVVVATTRELVARERSPAAIGWTAARSRCVLAGLALPWVPTMCILLGSALWTVLEFLRSLA